MTAPLHAPTGEALVASPDWDDPRAEQLRLNPRLPPALREAAVAAVETHRRPGTIWVATSGTTAGGSDGQPTALTLIALPTIAFAFAGRAMNGWLRAGPRDRWLDPLPPFHVGSLAIRARAHLAGAGVQPWWHPSQPWDPHALHRALAGVTLTSLVPTQLRDLVDQGLRPPASLRAVLVGGDALSLELEARARACGWPVLASYGMTESCAAIACAPLARLREPVERPPRLVLLPHVQARPGDDGRLLLRGPSLLAGRLRVTAEGAQWQPGPDADGWVATSDRVEWTASASGTALRPIGRMDDLVKVAGEGVDLARLRAVLTRAATDAGSAPTRWAVFDVADPRRGRAIALATEEPDELARAAVVAAFSAHVLPFERPVRTDLWPALPRTPLGKLALPSDRARTP